MDKKKEIIDIIREIQEASLKPEEGAQSCLVVGSTGSGKSTIINMLSNVPLQFQKLKQRKYSFKHKNHIEGAPIGNDQFVTCTTKIGVYRSNKNTYIDIPAERTTGQKHLALQKTITESNFYGQGQQIKFIFVTDSYEITQEQPIQFMNNIRNALTRFDLETLKCVCGSMMMVVNKFGANSQISGLEEVVQCIQYIAEKEKNQKNQIVKVCLQYLIKSQKIFILPLPDQKQFSECLTKIKQQLQNLPYTTLQYDYPSYANEENQYQLKKSIKELQEQLKEVSLKIIQKLKINFDPNPKIKIKDNITALKEAEDVLRRGVGEEEQGKLMKILGVSKEGKKIMELIGDIDYLERFVEKSGGGPQTDYFEEIVEVIFELLGKNERENLQNKEIKMIKDNFGHRMEAERQETRGYMDQQLQNRKNLPVPQFYPKNFSVPQANQYSSQSYSQSSQQYQQYGRHNQPYPQPYSHPYPPQPYGIHHRHSQAGQEQDVGFFSRIFNSITNLIFGNPKKKKRVYRLPNQNIGYPYQQQQYVPQYVPETRVNQNADLEDYENSHPGSYEEMLRQISQLQNIKRAQQVKLNNIRNPTSANTNNMHSRR